MYAKNMSLSFLKIFTSTRLISNEISVNYLKFQETYSTAAVVNVLTFKRHKKHFDKNPFPAISGGCKSTVLTLFEISSSPHKVSDATQGSVFKAEIF